MANKLKDLCITSVDLVEQGANQEAHIKIIKRKDEDMQELYKTLIEKSGQLFESSRRIQQQDVDDSVKEQAFEKSLLQFLTDVVKSATPEEEIDKSETIEEVEAVEEVEVEEPVTVAEDVQDVEAEEETVEEDVEKSYEETVDINKALQARIEELTKSQQELKKQIELDKLEKFARKYEAIGEKPVELAKTLYDLKQAGNNIYSTYITALDKTLEIQEASGIFKEFGTSQSNEEPDSYEAVVKQYEAQGLSGVELYETISRDYPEFNE